MLACDGRMSSSARPPHEPATAISWPLAGSADFGRSALPRAKLAARFERDLHLHVLNRWFPACIDREAGGFFCDFDRRWQRSGPQLRRLEFQARQTRTAARAAVAYPSEPRWREAALHGFEYLRGAMHDKAEGGWFFLVDREGRPLEQGTKHAHGMAYLVGAFAEVYRVTGHQSALSCAREAFEWLEEVLYDHEHGGYHGWATRDGRAITSPEQRPNPALILDPAGHAIGLKDANVHSDLLEGFTLLAAAWPDPRLLSRLGEVYDILVSRLCTPSGAIHYMAHPDWTPVPTLERYGYPLQTAFRLPAAAAALGRPLDVGLSHSRLMVDHAVDLGWRGNGEGFMFAGPGAPPFALEGSALTVAVRSWWVQAEGLKALLLLAANMPESRFYAHFATEQARCIDRHLIDRRYGGWYMSARSDLPLWRRLPITKSAHKGSIWKDASHDGEMYLSGIRILRGFPDHRPIAPKPP
jgi:mannobiose 2-epimerase